MKRLSTIPLLFCFVLWFTGCEKTALNHEMGDTATLDFHDVASFDDNGSAVTIKFVDLIEDSRCPRTANCIWAGRVVVEFSVNDATPLILGMGNLTAGTDVPYRRVDTIGNHRFELMEASMGADHNQGEARQYTVAVKIDRI